MAGSPGILPKAALTTSRVIYKPFTIPLRLTASAETVGAAGHNLVGGINGAVGSAYMSLQPKGPAKLLVPLFVKTQEAVGKSQEKAQRNSEVFWRPMSEGVEGVGRAIAGPGAYYYAKRAGIEPTGDNIRGLLNLGLFDYPVGGGGQQQAGPPPEAAAQGAAEGAAQAA